MKILCHTKNQENHNLNVKRQSTDANTRMNQILELPNKDFKAAIIKLFQRAITNTFEANEKPENLIIIEDIKKETNGNYRKSTIIEIKNALSGHNSRMNRTKERISEPEDRTREINPI